MEPLTYENLQITVDRRTPGVVRLHWAGKSDSREPAKGIGPYLARILGGAESSQSTIEMHFESLAYFNSSTIAALIQFINQSRARGVSVVLHYDNKQRWQCLSFEALKRAITVFQSKGGGSVRFVESSPL